MKKFISILALIASLTAFAGDSEEVEMKGDCNKNQATINECANKQFVEADKELNTLYRQKLSTLSNKFYASSLREAQLAWIRFRDRDCLYQVGPEDGRGSISDLVLASCKYAHTKRRINDLNRYISWTENGCPY